MGPLLQAYVARFTTDRRVALVHDMALGKLGAAAAEAELASFKVGSWVVAKQKSLSFCLAPREPFKESELP